ncbi:SDR family NAD(P)-dependent oxidoreductase [Oricola sp.]|uniref:SDR family NAD(P)-dependent oxidoreductase n=1 Tax=Oricola sp. TaxID=1979950 RepID=UPI003BA9435C
MPLYRIKKGDGAVWITGASSGIGRELVLQMAREGYTVAATARSADKLDEMVTEAAGWRGTIVAYPCDVTDRNAMQATVRQIAAETGPIRLAVFNAGSYFPTYGDAIDLDRFRDSYEVNLFGVLNGLAPVVDHMRAEGRGQVVFVGSVSAYSGLPAASAYGASKAALNNMAESLLFDLEKMSIRVQVVNPGFVDTPATEQNDFAMPALMPVDAAVEQMVAGIERGGFEVTFPRRFTYVLKLLRMLPHPLYFWLVKRSTGWSKRPVATPAPAHRVE